MPLAVPAHWVSWPRLMGWAGSFPMAVKNPYKTNSGSPRCPRLIHDWKWGSRTTLGFKDIKEERACHLIHEPFQAWTRCNAIRAIRYHRAVQFAFTAIAEGVTIPWNDHLGVSENGRLIQLIPQMPSLIVFNRENDD